ncbi:MAG: hypothetical protein J6V83_03800, partial [Clostridia bacterium]|nr:hypothetical protein [Clostridia bacterium]
TLVGAGFASGKEIATFLGETNVLCAVLTAFIIGAFSLPFTILGSKSYGDIIDAIFKDHSDIGELIIRIINFIMLAAMLGGAESILYLSLGVRGGGFITAAFCVIAVRGGSKMLKTLNFVLMPVILTSVTIIYFYGGGDIQGHFTMLRPLLYVGMNAFCAGLIVGKMSSGITIKDSLIVALIIAIFMSGALLIIRGTISGYENYELPLLEVCTNLNLKPIGGAIIYSSILTSALATLMLATPQKSSFKGLITVCFAYLLSIIGFEKLINYAYPLIGAIGLIIFIIILYRLYKYKLNAKLGALSL